MSGKAILWSGQVNGAAPTAAEPVSLKPLIDVRIWLSAEWAF